MRIRFKRGFWKGLLAAAVAFGAFAVLVSVYPTYSPPVAVGAVTWWTLGVIVAAWGIQTKKWWLQLAYWDIFLLFFMGMAMRAWYVVLDRGVFWGVLAAALGLHAVAWAFPWMFPRLSASLAQEQLTPTTRMGRFIQVFSMSLIPGIGGLALIVQRLTEETGLERLDAALIALLGSMLAIAGPQAISHQIWEKRPWAASPQGAQPRTPG